MRQILDNDSWDKNVMAADGHPLQLWGWGEVKAKHGWQVYRYEVESASGWKGVQVLIKSLPRPFGALAYVPRGPVGQWSKEDLETLASEMKRLHRPVLLKIEPTQEVFNASSGWKQSKRNILLSHTLILDLSRTTDELMAAMNKKTRQYIRKSAADVEIRQARPGEITRCLEIYKQTAKRAQFALHSDRYYQDIVTNLKEQSPIYVAIDKGTDQIEAFLWLAVSESIAFELYGGITDQGQKLRANYALKWQAIESMKAKGVRQYDFNGLLNEGVSNFKQGFASHETTLAGTFDRPLSPLYPVWTRALPLAKRIVRSIKRR